jgi:hypothetical protein
MLVPALTNMPGQTRHPRQRCRWNLPCGCVSVRPDRPTVGAFTEFSLDPMTESTVCNTGFTEVTSPKHALNSIIN